LCRSHVSTLRATGHLTARFSQTVSGP
jgi:hypothetical protein